MSDPIKRLLGEDLRTAAHYFVEQNPPDDLVDREGVQQAARQACLAAGLSSVGSDEFGLDPEGNAVWFSDGSTAILDGHWRVLE